jgi:hypothetical protein
MGGTQQDLGIPFTGIRRRSAREKADGIKEMRRAKARQTT